MTVNEAIPKYLEHVKLYSKPDTLKYYKQYLRFISNYIGDVEIDHLTRDEVSLMLQAKKIDNPNISNSTLNKYIGTLSLHNKQNTQRWQAETKAKIHKHC